MRLVAFRVPLLASIVWFGSFRLLPVVPRRGMSLTRKAELGYHYAGKETLIVGVDEAGRGPLAGPVVTAACYIKNGVHIEGINDSKQTKEEDREAMYHVLTSHPDVCWSATVVSHTEIDEVNILQATMNGMRRSTESLLEKLHKLHPKSNFRALVDGNRVPSDMPIDATYVIKGDSIIFSIAAASIIAKVTRDRLMLELDKEFPQYNFAQHKGYPTFEHRSLLMKYGPCRVHRASYGPVKLAMTAHNIASIADLENSVISPTPAAASSAKRASKVATKTSIAVKVGRGGKTAASAAAKPTKSDDKSNTKKSAQGKRAATKVKSAVSNAASVTAPKRGRRGSEVDSLLTVTTTRTRQRGDTSATAAKNAQASAVANTATSAATAPESSRGNNPTSKAVVKRRNSTKTGSPVDQVTAEHSVTTKASGKRKRPDSATVSEDKIGSEPNARRSARLRK